MPSSISLFLPFRTVKLHLPNRANRSISQALMASSKPKSSGSIRNPSIYPGTGARQNSHRVPQSDESDSSYSQRSQEDHVSPSHSSHSLNRRDFSTFAGEDSKHDHLKTATSRLGLISRHLSGQHPTYELNTPYLTERQSSPEEEFDEPLFGKQEDRREGNPEWSLASRDNTEEQEYKQQKAKEETDISLEEQQSEQQEAKKESDIPPEEKKEESPTPKPLGNMSSQAPHPTVLIPGPIEYDDEVLNSMSHFSQSHVGPPFVATFSSVLTQLRSLFCTTNPSSQPFVISGSGTLGWDQVAANLAQPGDNVLVLHTGYFADSFADCFKIYGSKPTQLKAPVGQRPQLDQVEAALKENHYKILTVTHVDTSTGVLFPEIPQLVQLVRRVSPETLVVVDGVCSVGAEPLSFDAWDIDVVLTASQKAIGCPAGLSIVMASERAMQRFHSRSTPPGSYFASWSNWEPIMRNYEAKKPSYFATPSPQLVHALDTALKQILARPLEERFEKHKTVSRRVKQKVEALGLKQLPPNEEDQASTMTAIWLPEGLVATEFLPGLLERGVVFAGGLHKECAPKYVRFGHMGVTVMAEESRGEVDKALKALEERLAEVKKA